MTSNNKKGQITDLKSNMIMSKFIMETFFDRDFFKFDECEGTCQPLHLVYGAQVLQFTQRVPRMPL